jgi:transposase-like protein
VNDHRIDQILENERREGIVNLGGGLATGMIGGSFGSRGDGLVGTGAPSYRGFRFPVEIISHCVWLYYRFPLSFREVEEMMLQRGIVVSHETIRQWSRKFGQTYANGLRRRRARPGDTWHLDEVFLTINGQRQYLWRAVDQDGTVLDILVTSRRDATAATRFFRKLLTGLEYAPRVLVTDSQLQRGTPTADARGGAPPIEVSEQPRGELTPTDPGTRTRDETLHLTRSRAAVLVRVQWDIPTLPDPSSPSPRPGIPARDGQPFQYLERSHQADHRSLNHPKDPTVPPQPRTE